MHAKAKSAKMANPAGYTYEEPFAATLLVVFELIRATTATAFQSR
jgi:hypothetical protein